MSEPGASGHEDAAYRRPGFVANHLVPALDAFEESLNRRWRADVVEHLYRANEAGGLLPADTDPAPDRDKRWDDQLYTHVRGVGGVAGSSHSNPGDYCTYVQWVKSGQDGDLGDVADHQPPDGGLGDIRSTDDPSDYEYDSCPIGNGVFREIEELAKRERDNVLRSVPFFDAHNVTEIEQAHGALVELCAILGLDIGNDVGLTGHSALATLVEVDLQKWLGGGTDVAWWAHWTSLVPDILADGDDSDAFFQSTMPTRHYHSQIAACLANLLNIRAAIILNTRKNVVNAITNAAARQDKHAFQDKTLDTPTIFTVVAVGAMVLALTPVSPVVAGGLALVSFLGDHMEDRSSSELVYQDSRQGIVDDLNREIADVNTMLHDDEMKYTRSVSGLANDIRALKPSHRALYNFTKDAKGAKGVPGFEVDPDDTLLIARCCFRASEEYESTIDVLVRADIGDAHLRDSEGAALWADAQVTEIRETLIDFCKTTIARYFEAGQQTKDGLERTRKVDRASADTWAMYEAQLDAARAARQRGGEDPYSPDNPDYNGSAQGSGGGSDDHLAQPTDKRLDSQPVDPTQPHGPIR